MSLSSPTVKHLESKSGKLSQFATAGSSSDEEVFVKIWILHVWSLMGVITPPTGAILHVNDYHLPQTVDSYTIYLLLQQQNYATYVYNTREMGACLQRIVYRYRQSALGMSAIQ